MAAAAEPSIGFIPTDTISAAAFPTLNLHHKMMMFSVFNIGQFTQYDGGANFGL
jgi:hypothetical protein